MSTIVTRFEPQTYALLRIVLGFLFFWHGSQKVLGFPPSAHEAPALITWVAGPIELVGGLLVMVGLFTGWAAFLCSGLMGTLGSSSRYSSSATTPSGFSERRIAHNIDSGWENS